ncbi:MAG TPA: bifunctional (p)ppGpp synthetase/guanosine-3',5'-bis(diphosphate) 3'-pyrophosphohydrolase [Thermoanaerobaculia bacterium]|nr:bifunctional (p)ppGpp synthetase/guanosine-3',5'-bis(diphosphate) 3'-pyrophosphohydrolase [Thermoanaerobaculia bacterium]
MALAAKKLPPPPVAARRAVQLEDIIRQLGLAGRPVDESFLRAVYDFSVRMHGDQVRRSGEPFMIHPLQVSFLLAELKFDQTCAAVGLLHDVIEDTLTTREILEAEFGPEVAELVDGVTKIGRHEYVRRDDAQAETFRKMILASAKDIRVIVIKLADRLHNMQTLEHLAVEARQRISRETLEIYAPIAHRLGMARVKGDLEDLAFYHLFPLQFAELYSKIEEKKKLGESLTLRVRDRLSRTLEAAGIEAEISFRIKRYYSIYEKLRRQGIDISQLYDYLAFRIVTGSMRDTYGALGIVHQGWRPIPGRFKDYIAMPKPNLYQSLHTTVVGEGGQPFEVQIRTRDMDLIAEEGIAAHWRYKEGRPGVREKDGDNVVWLRQLLEWQQEVPDSRAFLTALKVDLYPDEVYVFSPKGEVFAFPRGATPLDFAYHVHTDLGHQCSGARVNGRLVPIRTALQNGDLVEILSTTGRQPSRDWLSFVVTSRAKSKIRQWLNIEQKQRAMEIGRRIFEKEARRYKLNPKKILESPELAKYTAEEGIGKPDDLLARIGFGKIEVRQILTRVVGDDRLTEVPVAKPSPLRQAVGRLLPFGNGPILVKGQGDLLAYLAKCCNPLPGEDIIGYVTRGRGVSVHSADCPNVRNLLYNPDREIEVEWARRSEDRYRIALTMEADNQPGVLARVTEAITKAESNISQISAETEGEHARVEAVVELRDRKHLDKLLRIVRSIVGVRRVERRMTGAGSDDSL